MIIVSDRKDNYNAIRFVRALRKATGIGLKEGLARVEDLANGKPVVIENLSPGLAESQVLDWLRECGVIAQVSR